MKHVDIIANDWNLGSDNYYARTYSGNPLEKIIDDPMWAFPPEVRSMLAEAVPDLRGKKVLVASSGDNAAVFAFHLMGAIVTSTDIAENQLKNARRIADDHRWDIEFKQANSMTLEGVADSEFDLVYTSNGVHVWINDLPAMYSNIRRVLKPGGRYIMFETHPFIRPFGDEAHGTMIPVRKLYEDLGPFGEVPVMAWRIMDLLNAMTQSGLTILRMEEFHSSPDCHDCWWYDSIAEGDADGGQKGDWQKNPFAALPQWIGFSTVK